VIYIGWGKQRRTTDYSPPGFPAFQDEFVDEVGELIEMTDPSVELEEIWRGIMEERRRTEDSVEEGVEDESVEEEMMIT
jgi:Radial spokehead-like protein